MKDYSSGAVAPPIAHGHTPGPWFIEGPDPAKTNPNMGLWCVESGSNVANDCTYADALLIAAAPDLLAALREIKRTNEHYNYGTKLLRIVNAAIAKATP